MDLEDVADVGEAVGAGAKLVKLALKHKDLIEMSAAGAGLIGSILSPWFYPAVYIGGGILIALLFLVGLGWWDKRRAALLKASLVPMAPIVPEGATSEPGINWELENLQNWLRHCADNFDIAFNRSDCWARFEAEHKRYYKDNQGTPCPKTPFDGDISTFILVSQNWFRNVKPKLTHLSANQMPALSRLRDATSALDQIIGQWLEIYKELVILSMDVDPSDQYNLFHQFHAAYQDTIEPVEKAILPIQTKYKLRWSRKGGIIENFKEHSAYRRASNKQRLKDLLSRGTQDA